MDVYANGAGLLCGADGAGDVGLCGSGGSARHRRTRLTAIRWGKIPTLKTLLMSAFPKGLTPGVYPHTDSFTRLRLYRPVLYRDGLSGSCRDAVDVRNARRIVYRYEGVKSYAATGAAGCAATSA
jgi:hypothetical protein